MSSIQERQFSKTILAIITVVIVTILAGEIKIIPFEDTTFRFALGSIVFLLSILVLKIPVLITGIITALLIVPTRAFIAFLFYDASFIEQLILNSPAFAFYITYTAILVITRVQQKKKHTLYIFFAAIVAEILANCSEQLANLFLFNVEHFELQNMILLSIVAVLRSLFTIGLFSLVTANEQKKQTDQLLAIGSNLYTEALYVKKMMELIEDITQDSFKIHQYLRKNAPEKALEALMISQNIHEVKKDLERVYAGLNKIVVAEHSHSYHVDDLLRLVVEANTKYSNWLQKTITFQLHSAENFSTKEPFLLLSIMNNIVANAIEAIQQQGTITISTERTASHFFITIENDGPPIPEQLLPAIFDAGYTTKFNEQGVASTGIGLNHVQTMCEKLNGTINVTSDKTTIFTIKIPIYTLLK